MHKPTTTAELEAALKAAKQITAKGFTYCHDATYIRERGGINCVFAFSRESARACYGHPAAEVVVPVTPFAVNWWGSNPDEENDDCWTGSDHPTLEEARAFFDAELTGPDARDTAFVELTGPNLHEVRAVPGYDAEARAAEQRADDEAWKREIANEAGMLGGCAAYNETMGF